MHLRTKTLFCVRIGQIALLIFILMFLLSAYVAHASALSEQAVQSLTTAIAVVRWNCMFIVVFGLSVMFFQPSQGTASLYGRYVNIVCVSMGLVFISSLLFALPIGLKYLLDYPALAFITPYSTLFFVFGYLGLIVAMGIRFTYYTRLTGQPNND